MESWRVVWRALGKRLSLKALRALESALERDDPKLLQGATTSPPPLECVKDWPCEGACVIGYAGWQGEEIGTVGDVEDYFARACFQVDQDLQEPAACRWLINWADDTPRAEMRRELLPEVRRSIELRQEMEAMT